MTLCRKSWAEMIPNDPVMLLSFVNMKLRDEFSDLDELCGALDVSREDLERRLTALGYVYNEKTNQFK
mgnify:FL=1